MPSNFNVAGTFQVPSATESPVFADGTRSVPATIGRKVAGIGLESSGIEEPERLRSSAAIGRWTDLEGPVPLLSGQHCS